MKKIFIFILALVIVLSAFVLSQYDAIDTGYAKSTPRVVGTDCPDDHVCFWAIQKTTGNIMCRANTNDAWQWKDDPPEPCGGSSDKSNTSTPKPVVVNQPTNTLPAANTQLPTATKKPNHSSGDTDNKPTATYVLGENPDQICNWCDLQSTDTAAQATQASAQSTIAAKLSGGD